MEPKRTFTIGQNTDCDIVLADESVRRHHVGLSPLDDGRWLLTDLDGRFGTFIVR